MENKFKPGFDNSAVNVKVYSAFAFGPEPVGKRYIVHFYACKKSECDRFACTASAEWCSQFCCLGCASGTGCTEDCDKYIGSMRAQLIPGVPTMESMDTVYLERLRGHRLPYRENDLKRGMTIQ
jgi:hypothetical protein